MANRWGRLNQAVSKSVDCYEQIQHRKESAINEGYKKNREKQLYLENIGKDFAFMHVWVVIKDEEKWSSQSERAKPLDCDEDRGGSKRTKNTASGQYTSSSSNTTMPSRGEPKTVFSSSSPR
ncbi:unnamed protein product [Linum trigynum]|uniref:No apical meristem-associated C-terminal domain-containing protein n=1 Tax=Linum trigynum TaxID=586398 RepID=A0AAV2FHU6_9ROSI